MTAFKVGDRVNIIYSRRGNTKAWDGPGTITEIRKDYVHIYSDTYGSEGGFKYGEFEPLANEGMSSKDLADAVENTIRATRERVEGVGDAQYSTDKGQAFEGLKVSELLRMAREEAQDLCVYAVMTDIRLARIEAAIEGEGM